MTSPIEKTMTTMTMIVVIITCTTIYRC